MNNVVLIGRMAREPELKFLQSGLAVCNFTLAIDKNLSKDKKQEYESKGYPTADFINIVVYGKQAENCANYLDKGRLTAVQGRIQTRSYEAKDGTRRYVTEVVASYVEFLEWKKQNDDIDGFSQVDNADLPF